MTIERVHELKSIYEKEVIYFGNIDFPNTQAKFQTVVDFLNEIEAVIKENEELKAQLQVLEDQARDRVREAAAAREGEGCCD